MIAEDREERPHRGNADWNALLVSNLFIPEKEKLSWELARENASIQMDGVPCINIA